MNYIFEAELREKTDLPDSSMSFKEIKRQMDIFRNRDGFLDGVMLEYFNLLFQYKHKKAIEDINNLIEEKLGIPDTHDGEYSFAEISKVLGVSKYQARVIENMALNQMKRPEVGKKFKEYLLYD